MTRMSNMSTNKKDWLKEFLLLNAGTTVIALGIYWFRFPNNFAVGGVSGLAVVIDRLFHTSTPAFLVTVINLILLVVGLLIFGKDFGVKSIYCTVLFMVEMWALQLLWPISHPFTDQPLMELIFATVMVGGGSAVLFNINASTGGTDIIAMILKKYTSMDIGKSLLVADLLIAASALLVFDIRTGLFSLLGLGMKTFVVDSVIESINLCKYFTIVTVRPDEICHYIIHDMHHGATKVDAVGAFTEADKTLILTACRRSQAIWLRRKVKEIDPSAFMFITNTSEIIGKGFRA